MDIRAPGGARELVVAATLRLAEAGVASPRVDAELLLAHALAVSRGGLITAPAATSAQATAFRVLVERRVSREPLQHLLGAAAFRHLELAVGPGVFVPRPETESLIDLAAPYLRSLGSPVVLDLCAGSGAVGLAIHQEFATSSVVAVERSEDALRWLRDNAAALAPGARFSVVAGDVTDATLTDSPVLAGLVGRVDMVLANPPYVPAGTSVDLEVSHDPAAAVFAGLDGLALMPAVFSLAARMLRPGAVVVVEHSESHAGALIDLVTSSGHWVEVVEHVDLAGRDRFVSARRVRA